MGANQPCQRRQLARRAHPHFEDAEARLARHPCERERDAGVIVVALHRAMRLAGRGAVEGGVERLLRAGLADRAGDAGNSSVCADTGSPARSEEHTSELQSLMRISYAVFVLTNKTRHNKDTT